MSTYGVVGAIALLLVVIVILVLNIRYKNNKQAAEEFLSNLTQEITSIALNIIDGFNPDDYETIEEFELGILNTVYDKLFDYVLHEIENSKDIGAITKAVAKKIDKDFVVAFIDNLFNKKDIINVIESRYTGEAIAIPDDVEAEDKSLEKKFDSDEYNDKEISVDDLPSGEIELTEDEQAQIAALNPQKDDEEELAPDNDSSLEYEDEINEVPPTIVKKVDKAGKTRYYEIIDGKKHAVSKDYAARFLSPDEM